MKKLYLLFVFLILSLGAFSQNKFKYEIRANGGIRVGGSTHVRIDSILLSGDEIKIYNGLTLLGVYGLLSVSDTASMLTTYINKADTAAMLDTYARLFNPVFTGTLIKINTDTVATRSYARSIAGTGSGGSGVWGLITGTLADQLDLQSALNAKADLASPTFTGTVTLPASTSIGNVSSTEISHVDGARSNFQTQLDDTITFAESLDDNANYIQAMIDASLASYGGGSGTSGQYSYLSGITGVTAGFPGAGDSLVIHTNFIGRYPIVFREGNFQQRHENNLSYDGYRFNTTTGTLTFRPPFAAGEQLEIWATNTILYQQLTPEGGEGGGGEPPENVLLDNLRAYWSFDEVSGTTVSDKTGTYPGVSNGSTEPYGINGYTRSYTRSHSHYSYFGATVGDMGTDDFSISLWYYRPELIEGYLGILGNWGSVPYWYLALDEGSNNVYFQFNPSSPVNTYANSVPAASTWIHVVVTVDRSGDMTMYINGSAQADVGDISASSAVAMDNNATFSVGRIGNHIDGYYFHGYIDDVALFRGLVLTQEQVTYLYNSGIGKFYPFN